MQLTLAKVLTTSQPNPTPYSEIVCDNIAILYLTAFIQKVSSNLHIFTSIDALISKIVWPRKSFDNIISTYKLKLIMK